MLALSEADSADESSISYSDYNIDKHSHRFFTELLIAVHMNICSDQSLQVLDIKKVQVKLIHYY